VIYVPLGRQFANALEMQATDWALSVALQGVAGVRVVKAALNIRAIAMLLFATEVELEGEAVGSGGAVVFAMVEAAADAEAGGDGRVKVTIVVD
jgi:hypothetical protein